MIYGNAPWHSPWWAEICRCAEKNGSSAAEIIDLVSRQHAMGMPVGEDGYFVLAFTEDNALLAWIAVGRNAREWVGQAELQARAIAKALGMTKMRIEDSRRGWERLLPHWTRVGDDLELLIDG